MDILSHEAKGWSAHEAKGWSEPAVALMVVYLYSVILQRVPDPDEVGPTHHKDAV